MHTEHTPDDPEVLKEMGYDRRDLNVPALTKSTVITTVVCVILFIAAVPVYNYFSTPGGFFKGSATGATREAPMPSRMRFPEGTPMLQDNITTKLDISQMRKMERDHLENPSWIDKEKGIVRIPIKSAMEKIVERGVSTGKEVPAKTTGNTISNNAEGPGTSQPLRTQ